MTDVLHVPYTYFPDPTGGTETYVAALARGLRPRGLASAVAAPADGTSEYVHDGVQVVRFPTSPRLSLADLYGTGDPIAAAAFDAILERLSPGIVHLHGWTSGISLRLLRAARARAVPVVFTYHTPAVSCARGTLMIYGRDVCDGALLVDRCSRCVLQQRGVPLALGALLGGLPPAVGRRLGRLGLEGGVWTALRMTELIRERHRAFRSLVDEADHMVAVQDWVHDLLVFLGVSREKLTLSRLALPELEPARAATAARMDRSPGSTVRIGFFGRLHHTKGVHVLVEAMLALPGAPLRLDLYGAPQGEEGARYIDRLRRVAEGDERIRFLAPVPTPEVVGRMREYDVVAVPSIWMETGPLVVPESFSAGVPVLGSALGGIPRFVRDGVDGLLLPAGDVAAWADAFRRLVEDRHLLDRLRAGVGPPESMWRIVDEMAAVYRKLLPVRV